MEKRRCRSSVFFCQQSVTEGNHLPKADAAEWKRILRLLTHHHCAGATVPRPCKRRIKTRDIKSLVLEYTKFFVLEYTDLLGLVP